jgi:hypothetical protein
MLQYHLINTHTTELKKKRNFKQIQIKYKLKLNPRISDFIYIYWRPLTQTLKV